MQPLNGCALILLSIGLLNVQAESPPPEDAFESSNVVSNDDGTTNSEASKIQIREVPVSKPLGEVSAIAINSDGSLLAFHRGDRIWDKDSFTEDFKLSSSLDAIKNSTIYVIEPSTGNVMAEFGENEFYMPHGMTVDARGNIWVTDVGRHQVLRLDPETFKPTLILGEKLVPGDDESHFCQPTDVAVSSNGKFVFVADGYCNGRVVVFDSNGTFIEEFGKPATEMPAETGEFFVPHSIALIEDLNLVCVADRENQRIQCFSAGLGSRGDRRIAPTGMFITKAENIGRVFAIREKRHYLVGITGSDSEGLEPQIFVIDMDTGKADTFAKGLDGHSLAVDGSGNVYVARMHPNQILQMQL